MEQEQIMLRKVANIPNYLDPFNFGSKYMSHLTYAALFFLCFFRTYIDITNNVQGQYNP